MGETEKEEQSHEKGDEVKKKEKQTEEKAPKEKKGKDKEEKKKKNPADKTDPAKLRQKLEKLEIKMQALAIKKDEIFKLLKQAETNAPNPNPEEVPTISS